VKATAITQPCALPVLLTGVSVVRAYEGTRVLSAVEALAASATGASIRPVRSAHVQDLLQVSLCWRASGSSTAASVGGVSVLTATVVAAAGHESAEAVSVLGLKPVAVLAGVGAERPAAIARPAAPLAGGSGRPMQDQQDQFGTSGARTDGYAFFGGSADSTNPIDPRDFRTSSPPG